MLDSVTLNCGMIKENCDWNDKSLVFVLMLMAFSLTVHYVIYRNNINIIGKYDLYRQPDFVTVSTF